MEHKDPLSFVGSDDGDAAKSHNPLLNVFCDGVGAVPGPLVTGND